MSTSEFQKGIQDLFSKGLVSGVAIIDANKQIVWKHPDTWAPPVNEIFNTWSSKDITGFEVGGIRFAVIDRVDERFIAMNMRGQGGFIVVKLPKNSGFLLAFVPPGQNILEIYTDIAKVASLYK